MNLLSLWLRIWRIIFEILPHRGISAITFWFARIEQPFVKSLLISSYRALFPIRMEEAAEENPDRYPTLDAFFTRALKPEVRPWTSRPGIACPCDCDTASFGRITDGSLIHAKGHDYTAAALLGSEEDAERFEDGQFTSLYLSPRYCHRVFTPMDGDRILVRHIPGRQYSVAPWAVEHIPGLFARNERVVSLFSDPDGIPFAVVMIGALNVASIEIAGLGLVTPRRAAMQRWPEAQPAHLSRGDELGRFHMGSSVVVLSAHRDWQWDAEVAEGQFRAYGQPLLHPPGN